MDQPSKVTWLKLRDHYVPHMDWVPHTRQVAVEYLDRPQRDDRIYIADADSGDVRLIFEDTDSTYVDTIGFRGLHLDFTWLPSQGKPDTAPAALLWFSERDGWRHAYAVPLSPPQTQPRLLTDFEGDVLAPVALDPVGGSLFFTASPGDPIRSYLYRVSIISAGSPTRLSPRPRPAFTTSPIPPPTVCTRLKTSATPTRLRATPSRDSPTVTPSAPLPKIPNSPPSSPPSTPPSSSPTRPSAKA